MRPRADTSWTLLKIGLLGVAIALLHDAVATLLRPLAPHLGWLWP